MITDFANVCEQSTDFHFPDLEKQFERIEYDVTRANEWRAKQKENEMDDEASIKSASSNSSNEVSQRETSFYFQILL